MERIEQNISGVKLERLRKKACRRMKAARCVHWGIFGIGAALSLAWSVHGLSADALLKNLPVVLVMTGAGSVLSLMVSVLVYLLCVLLFAGKPGDVFSQSYKNKYVLMRLQEVPGFSGLRYRVNRGFPVEELCTACLPPVQHGPVIHFQDYWEGDYDCIHFRSAQVDVWPYESSIQLFEGQVMIFSLFDAHKISESPIQVFAREGEREKGLTFPVCAETENEAFNQKFSVHAQDGHNAFYILTPRVMEDIMAFSEMMQARVYIVFSGRCMYVGCEQGDNPFDAQVDVPVEEQSHRILRAAELIQKARDTLVHLEEDAKNKTI